MTTLTEVTVTPYAVVNDAWQVYRRAQQIPFPAQGAGDLMAAQSRLFTLTRAGRLRARLGHYRRPRRDLARHRRTGGRHRMALRDRGRLFRSRRQRKAGGAVNNGTYAAMTLGDAMSCQSSGSFAEPAETASSDGDELAALGGEGGAL